MRALLRSLRTWWFLRTIDRTFDRAHPELKKRREAIKAAQGQHRKTKHLQDELQQEMTRLLKAGL